MEVIAHRGACFEAPENSIEAFDLAIRAGADRLELDVHTSADGVPFICHDPTTKRVTATDVTIGQTDAASLRKLTLANGEPLPSLHRFLVRFSGRTALDVEIKDVPNSHLSEILALIDEFDMREGTLISSFHASTLTALRGLGWAGRTGLILGSKSLNPRQRAREAWPFRALGRVAATDLIIHHQLAHRLLRRRLHDKGLGLIVWLSIEDEMKPRGIYRGMYRRALEAGADGIIAGRVSEVGETLTGDVVSPGPIGLVDLDG